ncbi:hypothetical protein K0U91_06510 [Chryseobacterium chendengshani]|uniref:hypothetical protein n=1 Tax=Chryseobacterium sp. LJ668 TaxID=2864040 RepID=UPI001C693EFB|nr:hypothetical protein [Chryseobacterium sp. LJ668]MBW8522121.1 hypothetical protein [Chryseobacterium sp. LJ668]QYK17768.1 hypothetical protein K0U91_06510 [Chryseobacterium sp. LJ668]
MKKYLLILMVLLVSCEEEKTFADDIVLSFPNHTMMKIQRFNEDANEEGENLMYKGKFKTDINVKYFKNIYPEPLPPPKYNETQIDHNERIKKLNDSIDNIKNFYFRNERLKILDTEEDLTDFLSNRNLLIIIKEKDTIPLYKMDYGTKKIQAYKAYPIYIKNISTKILKIPIDASGVALYITNDIQFQFIRNSNYIICGMETNLNPYFELKPNEILIYSFPHLENGSKRKAKIVFFKAFSKEFEISIDEKIIKNQRSTHYLK